MHSVIKMFEAISIEAGIACFISTALAYIACKQFITSRIPKDDPNEGEIATKRDISGGAVGTYLLGEVISYRYGGMQTPTIGEAIIVTISNVIFSLILFLVCYWVMKIFGIRKDDDAARGALAFTVMSSVALAFEIISFWYLRGDL